MKTNEDLISVGTAARLLKRDRSNLRKRVVAGGVRSHPHASGVRMVYLSEVQEDLAASDHCKHPHLLAAAPPPPHPTQAPDPNPDERDDTVHPGMSFAEARRVEKIEAARLKQIERLKLENTLVNADAVVRHTFDLFRAQRDQLQAWPARIAAVMAAELGVDGNVLLVTLERYVRAFLQETVDRERGTLEAHEAKVRNANASK